VLDPHPGQVVLDATLGYGGHARKLLDRITPGGCLWGIDVDPIEIRRTEFRLRALGMLKGNSGSGASISPAFPNCWRKPVAVLILSWRIWAYPPCSWMIRRAASHLKWQGRLT